MYEYHRLEYISNIAYEFENSKEFLEYDQNINALKKKIERAIEKTIENMKLSDQLQQEAESMINNQRDALIKCIESHYHTISELNKKINESCHTRMEETLKNCLELKTEFEDIECEMNEKRKSKVITLFIAVKRSKQEIKRIESDIRRHNKRNNVTWYVFEDGEQARTYMNTIEDFGKLVEENLNSAEKDYFTYADQPDYTLGNYYRNYYQRLPRDTCQHYYSTVEVQFQTDPEPKVGQEPSALLIEQSTGRQDQIFASQTQLDLERFEHQNEKLLLRHQSDTCTPTPDSPTEQHEEQEMYKVLYPYESDGGIYLSCEKGDIVTVLTKNSGVNWKAKLNGRVGLIRKDYLKEIFESEPSVHLPPKPGPKPSIQAIQHAKESQGHRFSRQTRDKPVRFKALFPYTSRDEECLNIKKGEIITVLEKCPGDYYWAELRGQCGYVPKDHLEEFVETEANMSVLSELETKLRARNSVS